MNTIYSRQQRLLEDFPNLIKRRHHSSNEHKNIYNFLKMRHKGGSFLIADKRILRLWYEQKTFKMMISTFCTISPVNKL